MNAMHKLWLALLAFVAVGALAVFLRDLGYTTSQTALRSTA